MIRRVGCCIAVFLSLGFATQLFGQELIAPGGWVVVTRDGVFLQRGYQMVAAAPTGERLGVLKVRGEWIGVAVDAGGRLVGGWVHVTDVAKAGEAKPPPNYRLPLPPPMPPYVDPEVKGNSSPSDPVPKPLAEPPPREIDAKAPNEDAPKDAAPKDIAPKDSPEPAASEPAAAPKPKPESTP